MFKTKHRLSILDDYTPLYFYLIETLSECLRGMQERVYRLTSDSTDDSGCFLPNEENRQVARVRES